MTGRGLVVILKLYLNELVQKLTGHPVYGVPYSIYVESWFAGHLLIFKKNHFKMVLGSNLEFCQEAKFCLIHQITTFLWWIQQLICKQDICDKEQVSKLLHHDWQTGKSSFIIIEFWQFCPEATTIDMQQFHQFLTTSPKAM
jgi:hypothetical protein